MVAATLAAMFFDSHVHFDSFEGDFGIDAIVSRAQAAGISRILAVGADAKANDLAIEAVRRFPGVVSVAIGLDRDNATACADPSDRQAMLAAIESQIHAAAGQGIRVCAIGEIGLDFHYSPDTKTAQVALFREQLHMASRLNLPVIVHSRDAQDETLTELRKHADAGGNGVIHCFTGMADFARQVLELDFYVSFSGIVTFKKASALREIAPLIPDDHLLIETDSPYLAPEPFRGKRCEPAHLPHTAKIVAEIRGCSVEQLAAITLENAQRLFGLQP